LQPSLSASKKKFASGPQARYLTLSVVNRVIARDRAIG